MTVDEYLAGAPEPQRSTMASLRATLRKVLPDATEGLSYGVPAFFFAGKPVAGYAYFAKHCSYFPHSGSVLSTMEADLGGYSWAKGTLRFPIGEPLPQLLVEALVAARLAELEA